ncbi:MAG: glycosyltransferase family 39 protein [Treponema sp.]|nr:glycosyltransferase family 39 protein [Treponema sp.]
MEKYAMKKLAKTAMVLCTAAGVLSLVIFIPQVREMIISLGEKYVGRPLTHEVWHRRFINWELKFLVLAFALVFLFSGRIFEITERYAKVSWIFVGAVSVCLVIVAGVSSDIWVDEVYSLGLARHSVKDLVWLTAQDTLPPLYYIFLHLAMILFPNSVFAAKIVSVVPVVLLLCAATAFFAKEYSYRSALLFSALLASTYSVLQYAVEIRMYSWSLLFCGLCAISSWYMIKTGSLRSFLAYVLFAECGAYCHHWTAFGLALHFALVSAVCLAKDRKSLKNILIAAAVGVALYLPWAFVVVRQVSRVASNFWIPRITARNFIEFILTVIPLPGMAKIAAIAFIGWLFVLCAAIVRKKELNGCYLLACLLTPFLLILCATVISFAVRPLFVTRYALPLIAFVAFFIVLACEECKVSKRLVFVFICFGLLCSAVSMGVLFRSEKSVARTDRAFEEMMRENCTERTVFVFGETINGHIPCCIAYRYPHNRIYGYVISELRASVYFYDHKNLIDTLDGESDLCLVLQQDEEPPSEFARVEPIVAKMSTYPVHKFYFVKR